MDGLPRTVSLVIVASPASGQPSRVLGITEPTPVSTPWWPDTRPVVDAFGPVVVIRLLTADRLEDHWHVTYLAQLVDDRWVEAHQLHPWDGQLQPHPLRMPWAQPAGPQADLAWGWQQLAARRNRPAGPAIQHKTWNLSAVWELPGTNGTAWLKTVAPFGRHEAVVLKLLADHPVPQLLGHDRHRILLGDMSGTDGFGATVAEHSAIVDTLVDMQLATMDRVPQALTRGVPDRRTPRLAAELARSCNDERLEIHRCGVWLRIFRRASRRWRIAVYPT